MKLRLLVTGDIHIGKRPTRVLDVDLAAQASAARMWDRIVQRAIEEQIDAVLLSGDIVDHKNRFYEATGPLESGLDRLAKAKIQTYAVAGNHDWDVLPSIVKQLHTPCFHLLGQRGTWGSAYLEREGRRALRILGWSFPSQYVYESPLATFRVDPDPEMPTIGLLHGDIRKSDSEYCPVRLSELQAIRLSLWVLGHEHAPQYWPQDSGAHVLIPGTPQALAPDQPGPHGPWLIELDGTSLICCKQLLMSLVRYEDSDVDLAEARDEADFQTCVSKAVREARVAVTQEGHFPRLLSLRLNFKGLTALCGRVDVFSRNLTDFASYHDGVKVQIDTYRNLTRPAVNLAQLSQRNDLLGALCRTLAALESREPDNSVEVLLNDATVRLREVHRAPAYMDLIGHDLSVQHEDAQERLLEDARKILLEQGWQLLEALQSQVSQGQEAPG